MICSLHISRVYHSDFLFENPLLCYVVQSRRHPLMAIAYLFPLSFPASLARGGNTPLSKGGSLLRQLSSPVEMRRRQRMIRTAFLEEVKQVKRTDPLLHTRCRALCAVVYQAALLRTSEWYSRIDRSIVSVYLCTHPVHVIQKRPSRMMIDISWTVDMRLSG